MPNFKKNTKPAVKSAFKMKGPSGKGLKEKPAAFRKGGGGGGGSRRPVRQAGSLGRANVTQVAGSGPSNYTPSQNADLSSNWVQNIANKNKDPFTPHQTATNLGWKSALTKKGNVR